MEGSLNAVHVTLRKSNQADLDFLIFVQWNKTDPDCCNLSIKKFEINICSNIIIIYAVKLRDEGLSAKEIAEKLEEKKKDVCVLAVFDTLEYLKQGGRISKTAAWAGNILSIKPVIAIEKGEVAILGKARGSKNGNNILIQEVKNKNGIDFSMPYMLGYSGLDDSLLRKYIADSADLWALRSTVFPM